MNPQIQALYQQLTALVEQLVRAVCQEEGMTPEQTQTIVAICWAESGMNPNAVHHNTNGSTDYGVLQFNSATFIGPALPFPSPDFVIANPDACVREICRIVKNSPSGFNLWATYQNKAYLAYMTK